MSLEEIFLVVLGELSSFLSLLRMAFGLTRAVSHLEQRSTAAMKSVYPILSHRVSKFSFEVFQLVLKI